MNEVGHRNTPKDSFGISKPEDALRWLKKDYSVDQLNQINTHRLKENWIVAPLANGERAFLFYSSKSFYLIKNSYPKITEIEGAFEGYDADIIFDTEVILLPSGVMMILAVDIFEQHTSFYKSRKFLEEKIQNIHVSNLHLKPIAPSNYAQSAWQQWQHLPYTISGLIFIDAKQRKLSNRCLKWTPQSKLTLNVLLAESVTENENGSYFTIYLHDSDLRHRDWESDNDEFKNFNEIIKGLQHVPAYMNDDFSLNEYWHRPKFKINDLVGKKSIQYTRLDLWVPKEYARQSKFHIVEVEIVSKNTHEGSVTIEFEFKRIHWGKKKATSLKHADILIKQHFNPLLLNDIEFKPCDLSRLSLKLEIPTAENYKGDVKIFSLIFPNKPETITLLKNRKVNEVLLTNSLSHDLEIAIISFLSIPDLLNCRLVSNAICYAIDTMEVEDSIKDSYFHDCDSGGRPGFVMCDYFNDTFKLVREENELHLTLKSVILYMKMGGPAPKKEFYIDYDSENSATC